MNEDIEELEDAAYMELVFNGVTHRIPVTPEGARDWLEGEEAIGMGRGEPMVDEHGRLIEHHGFPEDPDAESSNPEVLGVPLDPEDLEAYEQVADENPYDDEP